MTIKVSNYIFGIPPTEKPIRKEIKEVPLASLTSSIFEYLGKKKITKTVYCLTGKETPLTLAKVCLKKGTRWWYAEQSRLILESTGQNCHRRDLQLLKVMKTNVRTTKQEN